MWPFKKSHPAKEPIINPTDSGLTDKQFRTLQTYKCPDCGGDLYTGPCGGMTMNVNCDNGHRFNITNPELAGMAPFIAERI